MFYIIFPIAAIYLRANNVNHNSVAVFEAMSEISYIWQSIRLVYQFAKPVNATISKLSSVLNFHIRCVILQGAVAMIRSILEFTNIIVCNLMLIEYRLLVLIQIYCLNLWTIAFFHTIFDRTDIDSLLRIYSKLASSWYRLVLLPSIHSFKFLTLLLTPLCILIAHNLNFNY